MRNKNGEVVYLVTAQENLAWQEMRDHGTVFVEYGANLANLNSRFRAYHSLQCHGLTAVNAVYKNGIEWRIA